MLMHGFARHLRSSVGRSVARAMLLWISLGLTLALLWSFVTHWVTPGFLDVSKWSKWPAMAVSVVLVLLAVSVFFRLSVGRKRLSPGYVLKPVQCVRLPSDYNPKVIATTIAMELGRLLGGQKKRLVQSPAGGSVTIANVSLSVEWLWSSLKGLITGSRHVVIETILFNSEEKLRLRMWAKGSGKYYEAQSDSFASMIDEDIGSVVIQLLVEVDPIQAGRIKQDFQDYDGAIGLVMEQPPSLDRDIELVNLLMATNRDDIALEQLGAVTEKYPLLPKRRRNQIREFRAAINAKIGNYASARKDLSELLLQRRLWRAGARADRRRWLKMMADCDRDDMRLDEALERYGQVESEVLQELIRVTGLPIGADLARCLRRFTAQPDIAVESLLWEVNEVFSSEATCQRMRMRDPSPEYLKQLEILGAIKVNPAMLLPWQMDARIAYVYRHLGRAVDAEHESAREYFQAASDAYTEAIQGEETGTRFRSEDLSARVDVAWCQCGKLLCQRALRPYGGVSALSESAQLSLRATRRLIEWLPEEGRSRFYEYWQSVMAPVDESGRTQAFVGAADLLTKAALARVDATEHRALAAQLIDVVRTGPRVVNDAEPSREMVAVPEGDEHSLLEAISAVLRVISNEDIEAIGIHEAKQVHEEGEQSTFDLCISQFDGLMPSRYHVSEREYGFACLASLLSPDAEILGDEDPVERVLLHLGQAIRLTESATTRSGMIGRARTDADFDNVRHHPKIRAMLGVA